LRRSMARSFSSSVRKLAVLGVSGRRKNMRMPQRKVIIPKIMKSHCIVWRYDSIIKLETWSVDIPSTTAHRS
jgi:hypothetical protein